MSAFREIADRCDDFDKEIADIQEARKKFWGGVRENIPARDVKALKDAIKARRKRKANLEVEEAHDQRVAEILAEIERGTEVALAHARRANDLPPHDEDGVIIEPAIAPAPGAKGLSLNGDAAGASGRFGGDASPTNPEAKATEVEPGMAGEQHPRKTKQPPGCVASRLAGGRTPVEEGAEPLGNDAPSHVSPAPVPPKTSAEAPGHTLALPSSEPGAPFPCEANGWAGLEPLPQFDRREKAA